MVALPTTSVSPRGSGPSDGGISPYGLPPQTTAPAMPGMPAVMPAVKKPAQPVDAYMSPYTDDVISSALKNLNDVGTQRRNALGADAFASGAYGDARHGVEDANLTKDMADSAGALTAGLKGDAFDKSMGWLNTDLDRQTNIGFQNAALDNQYFQNQLAMMGFNLNQGQNYGDALMGLDQYDRGNNQQQDNVNYQDWLDKRNWDSTKLSEFLSSINGTPGQVGSSSTSPDNSWASLIGSALGGLQGNGGGLFGGN